MRALFLALAAAGALQAPSPAPEASRPPETVVIDVIATNARGQAVETLKASDFVLREDGELANQNMATNAVGIDMAFPSNSYVRNHLGLAHQWENVGGVTARGFRIDLVSLGYPIPLVTSKVRLDTRPTLLSGPTNWARARSLSELEPSCTALT